MNDEYDLALQECCGRSRNNCECPACPHCGETLRCDCPDVPVKGWDDDAPASFWDEED